MSQTEHTTHRRRGLLTGTLAALLTGTAAVAAARAASLPAAGQDDELLRLGALLRAAAERENEAWASAAGAPDGSEAMTRAMALAAYTSSIVDRVEQLRATTLPGLLVKMQAVDWCCAGRADVLEMFDAGDHPTTDVRLVVGTWGDLRGLAEASA